MHTSLGGKWITVETIAAKIARNYKGLEFDIYDVVEWCAEVTNNIADFDGFQRFHHVPVTVKDRRALLPCNIWRLLHVWSGPNIAVLNYDNNGTFLRFQNNSVVNSNTLNVSPLRDGTVIYHIDYIGMPIDPDTGFPLIKEGAEEAAYWYCLTKLLFEDWLNKKIDNGQWQYINDQYGNYVQKSKSSFRFVSRDDMERFTMCAANLVPKLRFSRNVK